MTRANFGTLRWSGTALILGLTAGCSLVVSPELPAITADAGGTDAGGTDAGGTDAGTSNCTKHSDCQPQGASMICGPGGTCVDAFNANCGSAAGPLGNDDSIMVGSIMPTVGQFTSIGVPIEQAHELAILEINNAGGLPGGRRLVLVKCDSSGSSEQGQLAAAHLINTVGVPVIFGPAFSSIFIDVTTQVSARAGVMTISPSATSPTISGLDDDNLGWRTAASDVAQADAIADLVEARGFTKVIALGKDDAYGLGLLDGVNAKLSSVLQPDDYKTYTFADPGGDNPPDLAGLVSNALAAIPDPDAVVLLGTTEIAEIARLFEISLSNTSSVVTVRYIMADGGKADETIALTMADEGLIPRIEGTESNHKNGTLYNAFALRFQQRFGAPPGIYAANAYDAVYLVAYAMATVPEPQLLTGAGISEGMSRLVGNESAMSIDIAAGPPDYNRARNHLVANPANIIEFNGASGPLDFDSNGEAPANVARWAVEKRESNGEFRFINAGDYIEGEWTLP